MKDGSQELDSHHNVHQVYLPRLGLPSNLGNFPYPGFYRHDAWGAAFMSSLVVCTPRANCIADVTATEFYLSIIAHGCLWAVDD
jgi:hypothetical protein